MSRKSAYPDVRPLEPQGRQDESVVRGTGPLASGLRRFPRDRQDSRRYQGERLVEERHAFHTLLPPLMRLLHRRAMQLTCDNHRADDLVQATLLKAWANRDRYMPDTRLPAWLFTILRNTFLSDLRKRRYEVEDINGARAAAMSEEPRQFHALVLKEVFAAIALLPETQRRPLLLICIEGLSQLEAADACGCRVGTIKSRVSRGRSALQMAFRHDQIARPDPP